MLVCGVGNPARGDDGAGPCVAGLVAALNLPGVEVAVRREPIALVETMAGHDLVVIIDALSAQGRPGQVGVWSLDGSPAGPASSVLGSHGLGVLDGSPAGPASPVLGSHGLGVLDGSPARPAASVLGSHGLGVLDAVELARMLGSLPGRVWIVGIEGSGFELGDPLSAPVREHAVEAVWAVWSLVCATTARSRSPRRDGP